MVLVRDVMAALAELAPPTWAEEWDRVGLQLGDEGQACRRVLVALELRDDVVEQAVAAAYTLVVLHHPPLFRPLSQLPYETPFGRRLRALVSHGVAVAAAHTNWDRSPWGTSEALAQRLNLGNTRVLVPGGEALWKLVVYVPATHEAQVREALGKAGAGALGRYRDCTFRHPGTGTFRPLPGADPFLGQVGELSEVQEVRVETVVPAHARHEAVRAMLAVHPYEEVAYDLWPLAVERRDVGFGRVGELPEPMGFPEFCRWVEMRLGTRALRAEGRPSGPVRRVAVMGGSGASVIPAAARAEAEVLVTGDVGHHRMQEALDLGLVVVDAGHRATEEPGVAALAQHLARIAEGRGLSLDVVYVPGPVDDAVPAHGEGGKAHVREEG